ncbi:coiled-coil domain-containing protein-domain-containing protein [Pseudomassariella vexata]|uniref:Coiled-coil domain-containing protein-domain-containing protein n=1 Tax=Pseudomassariella vexata TaxID=1141098 RepID=A0A1Y2E9D8_9PEZI|nr:coiled-coil domain-containing protein-domain-containing protein [Pseudomassariella vexata]ORY67475.1 coiled-coil domain-containing protein-domain-containing protein [Pseudomassariella vexata]
MDATVEVTHPSPVQAEPFVKPQPRPPKSPAKSAQIRVHNRRREYLERHPTYFKSLEHELADPLLYDALIRRFQTAEERETEGRNKGYSRVLEVDLLRGEAKLTQLAEAAAKVNGGGNAPPSSDLFKSELPILEEEAKWAETKDEGRERWEEFLRCRFVHGLDEDFNYDPVDQNDALDVLERRDEEEAWFNEEEPEWVSEGGAENEGAKKKRLEGETGIQDF